MNEFFIGVIIITAAAVVFGLVKMYRMAKAAVEHERKNFYSE